MVPLSEITSVVDRKRERSRYHKNLQPVTYVYGEVAGQFEAPVYAILEMKSRLDEIMTPLGEELEIITTKLPEDSTRYIMKWDGEWHITYEVFRDMGIAFAVVMVLIYVLMVGWFKSFITPIIIMVPIPLTLVGILPAHGFFGVFFTATSMIGFIALAGIIVRNSILLVDFINLELQAGEPLETGRGQGGRRASRSDLPDPAFDHRRRIIHALGPDLPGSRPGHDLRHYRLDRPHSGCDPGVVLHVSEISWT